MSLTNTLPLHMLIYCENLTLHTILVTILRFQLIHYLLHTTIRITFRLHIGYSLLYHMLSDLKYDFNYAFRDSAYNFKTPHTTLTIPLRFCLRISYNFATSTDTLRILLYRHICL